MYIEIEVYFCFLRVGHVLFKFRSRGALLPPSKERGAISATSSGARWGGEWIPGRSAYDYVFVQTYLFCCVYI